MGIMSVTEDTRHRKENCVFIIGLGEVGTWEKLGKQDVILFNLCY